MKNLVLTIVISFIASVAFAQDMENFYMSQPQSEEECAKYIGKKVCTFDYSSVKNQRYNDSKKFDRYRNEATIFTITKIKFGKQIVLTLDSGRNTRKVKINNGGPAQSDELSSCNIFFLYDDFESYKSKLVGTIYRNKNDEEVAVLENIELLYRNDKDPILVSTLKSKINNEVFICFSCDVEDICKNIGMVISNPMVKDTYKVLSGHTLCLDSEIYDEKFKYIYAEVPYYTIKNMNSGKIDRCRFKSILTDPFEDDLRGKYISLLAEVEKPTNPEIRFGETMTIPSENGLSKFTYKDNVIDIMIFADRSNFNFVLQNISENSIKIVWDEAVFVNFDGSTEKVMHKGIKFSERNGAQPTTTIIKNAK